VKTLDSAHGHFVSCIRWAPDILKDVPIVDGENGATNGISKKEYVGKARIRCVIATGSESLYDITMDM